MNDLKVSICVPVYGGEKYIEKCARSLFGQTYPEIEFIFVNDCTKDRSIEVVQQVAEEFPRCKEALKIVQHDKNRGLAASRRTGVMAATGDYFFYIDEDDYLEPDAIERYVMKAKETDADMVVADFYFVSLEGRTHRVIPVPDDRIELVRLMLLRKTAIKIWGLLLRRSFVIGHELFAPEGLDLSEDYVLTPRMAYLANKVVRVDAPLLNYVRYNTESGSTVVRRRGLETTIKAMDILDDYFSRVQDAEVFKETLQQAKLYNKVTLYGLAAQADYGFLRPLYSDISVWRSSIELRYKILLTLASWGWDSFLFHVISHFKK